MQASTTFQIGQRVRVGEIVGTVRRVNKSGTIQVEYWVAKGALDPELWVDTFKAKHVVAR